MRVPEWLSKTANPPCNQALLRPKIGLETKFGPIMLLGRGRRLPGLHNAYLSEVVAGVSGTLTGRRRGKFGRQFLLSFSAAAFLLQRIGFMGSIPKTGASLILPLLGSSRRLILRALSIQTGNL